MRLSRFLVGIAFVVTSARAQIPDRRDVIQEARRHLGKAYVWDTCGPDTFDCSGFVYYVLRTSLGSARFPLAYDLRQIGGGYTAQSVYYRDYLAKAGARIACGLARSADVIFFPNPGTGGVNHIGFITDPRARKFLTAQNKATGVREESYAPGSKWGARAAECYRNIWLP